MKKGRLNVMRFVLAVILVGIAMLVMKSNQVTNRIVHELFDTGITGFIFVFLIYTGADLIKDIVLDILPKKEKSISQK